MTKRIVLLLIALLAATLSAQTAKPESTGQGLKQANSMGGGEAAISEKGTLRVFLLMGQSNMTGHGRADELKPPYTTKHDRIRIWANDRWEYFVPQKQFGPGLAMAHHLADHWPDDTIGIIKVAIGGTGIRAFEKNWTKEQANRSGDGRKGSLYADLLVAMDKAQKISHPEFSGFVWKQGGKDGKNAQLAAEYYDTFKQLIFDLRKDSGAPDLPVFVLTHMNDADLAKYKQNAGSRYPHISLIGQAQNKAGREIPHVHAVHHGRLPVKADGIHFNTEGQIKLGKLAATAIAHAYSAE